MLNARRRLIEDGELDVAHTRLVLNAMRSDTSVKIAYTPPAGNVYQFPFRKLVEDSPREKAPKEFRVRGRVKFPYGMSSHATALNIHYIDHERTRFIYKQAGARSYSRRTGWLQIWENRIEIELAWECSSKNPKVRLLSAYEAFRLMHEGVMKMCPTCNTLRTKGIK